MDKKEIRSVDDFHKTLRNHWHGHFIYRGEDSPEYTLCSKYGRFQNTNKKNDKENELALLNEFRRRALPMIENTPANEWEWLALAQHFGLATRLLDWTENPLIAAFFATRLEKLAHECVLYALEKTTIQPENLSISPFDIIDVVLYRPQHISPRITSQAGVFTVHPNPSKPFHDERIEKWIIKKECSIDINLTLQTYGINEASVFQDLEGLVRDLHLIYLWK